MNREWLALAVPLVGLGVGLALAVCWPLCVVPPHRSTPSVPSWSFLPAGHGDLQDLFVETEEGALPGTLAGRRIFPGGDQEKKEVGGHEGGQNATISKKIPLRLTLVLNVGGMRRFCRINGKLYGEGDEGPGFWVTRIGDEGAVITLADGEEVHIGIHDHDDNSSSVD